MSYETLNPFDPTIPEPVHVFMAGVVEPEEVAEGTMIANFTTDLDNRHVSVDIKGGKYGDRKYTVHVGDRICLIGQPVGVDSILTVAVIDVRLRTKLVKSLLNGCPKFDVDIFFVVDCIDGTSKRVAADDVRPLENEVAFYHNDEIHVVGRDSIRRCKVSVVHPIVYADVGDDSHVDVRTLYVAKHQQGLHIISAVVEPSGIVQSSLVGARIDGCGEIICVSARSCYAHIVPAILAAEEKKGFISQASSIPESVEREYIRIIASPLDNACTGTTPISMDTETIYSLYVRLQRVVARLWCL